jgi:hypothetical protein
MASGGDAHLIFNVPGRTSTYMPVDVNMPKEQLLQKYTRCSFSTENTWPYASPTAGFYDITNTSTKLVLYNDQKKWVISNYSPLFFSENIFN